MPSVLIQKRVNRVVGLSVHDSATIAGRGETLPPELERVDLDSDAYGRVNLAKGRGSEVVRDGDSFREATAQEMAAFTGAEQLDKQAQAKRAHIARAKNDPVLVALIKWLAVKHGVPVSQVAQEIKDLI